MNAVEELAKRRKMDGVRELLAQLWVVRAAKKEHSTFETAAGKLALEALTEVDGIRGNGVRFEVDGTEYAAVVMRNESEEWDAAPLIEWLKKKPEVWDRVSTTVLDPMKLAAEMASGNIPEKSVAKFKMKKTTAPFVKFVNPTPESQ